MRWLPFLAVPFVVAACGGDDATTTSSSTSSGTPSGTATGTGAGTATGVGGSGTGVGGSGGAGGSPTGVGGASALGSLGYTVNAQSEHDYGHQLVIPPGFGDAELTFELWIKPDDSFPVGSTNGGQEQLTNWSDADNAPYSTGSWWYDGNFLLDGHNNGSGFNLGTFSLQFYGGGRVRWLFGDGEFAGPGGHWSVGAFPATDTPSLLDGAWHHITLVRRFVGQTDADLELWIDGALVATETSTARTDMRQWFDGWTGFPAGQEGWFWGVEKQAAIGALSQYEDYKGLVAELRLWSLAKSPTEITNDFAAAVQGDEPGLVGWYPMNEGTGDTACDVLDPTRCITLLQMKPGHWNDEGPPLQ